MIFLSWCLTHWLVGDCGQPVSVWRQYQHTDASVVYARRSALLDLPDLKYGRRSSSSSKSLTYSIKNVRISTVSNISSGTSLKFYSKTLHHNTTKQFKAVWYHTYGKRCELRRQLNVFHVGPTVRYPKMNILLPMTSTLSDPVPPFASSCPQ